MGHARGRVTVAAASLVVLLVFLVGVHPISDNVVEHAELVCAAAVLALGFAVALHGGERPLPRSPLGRATAIRMPDPVRPALAFNEIRSLPLRR